jgi:phosphoglycolate phosphatase
MTPFPLLVFDLDGTLVDSLPDLTAALNRLMAARGLLDFARAEVAPMVGDGTRKLVERAFAARGQSAHPRDHDAFVADYTAHAAIATRLYPGVAQTLAALRVAGWRFAICTNKSVAATKVVLEALDLAPWFVAVGGGDSFAAHKPDPVHLRGTIAVAGGTPEHAIMTGDHANDVAVAKASGVCSIFAAWGYGKPGMADGATAVAQHFTELAAIAPRLLPSA